MLVNQSIAHQKSNNIVHFWLHMNIYIVEFFTCSCTSYQHWMCHILCGWHRREHSWMRLIWAENWEFSQMTMSSSSPLESSHAPPILIKTDVSSTTVRSFLFLLRIKSIKSFCLRLAAMVWSKRRQDKILASILFLSLASNQNHSFNPDFRIFGLFLDPNNLGSFFFIYCPSPVCLYS